MLRAAHRRPLRAVRCPAYGRFGAFALHLGLVPVHRRGWSSFCAALKKDRIDEDALKDLLASHDSGTENTSVCAVDVSPWPRDSELKVGFKPARMGADENRGRR